AAARERARGPHRPLAESTARTAAKPAAAPRVRGRAELGRPHGARPRPDGAARMTFDVPKPVRWLVAALFHNLGLKAFALGLTVLLFVVTRDEVTRHFEVPLRIIEDPMRVPLTPLPETVKVAVRGPWTRVNRLQPYDLGSATLDLRNAEPGPLNIDRASIVMPPGVVLSGLSYDEVDLRFDPIVRAVVPIEAQIVGAVDPDHRLVATEVEPDTWTIEGGSSAAQTVSRLLTEAVHVGGVRTSLEREVAIVPPEANVRL